MTKGIKWFFNIYMFLFYLVSFASVIYLVIKGSMFLGVIGFFTWLGSLVIYITLVTEEETI